MNVRFSKHAILRLAQRFNGHAAHLAEILERGIFEKGARSAHSLRWSVDGVINAKPVRVVFVEEGLGEFTILTAMWIDDQKNFSRIPRADSVKSHSAREEGKL